MDEKKKIEIEMYDIYISKSTSLVGLTLRKVNSVGRFARYCLRRVEFLTYND